MGVVYSSVASKPDPYLLKENPFNNSWRAVAGLSYRSKMIDPAKKTLILGCSGQSICSNVLPSLHLPTDGAVVDQMNIYDGALYDVQGPLLGTTQGAAPHGPGNLLTYLADKRLAKFDRVILCPTSIGSTKMADWGDPTGTHYNRAPVMVRRLAASGITPSTPGAYFAWLLSIGEDDNVAGTSQASFQASGGGFISNLIAAGFSGRIFVTQESRTADTTSAAVRAAQAALVDNVTVFSAGDLDALDDTNRQDTVHFTNAGADAAATIIDDAMTASGSPF